MAEKKIFLLDAMALIFRAYYALNKNPRINSKGLNTSAILGFTNTLYEILKNEKPTHIGVAFDSIEPTVRHLEFEEYKGHRSDTPDDIITSLPYIRQVIEAFGIPVLIMPGYEADDIIGTMAKRAEKHDFKVFMMTSDKDFGQLVSENIKVYRPARMGNGAEIIGVEEVCQKYEIDTPEQLIDILGLWGDAADNIPGIPGVGEVTAKKLIAQFGSIENMIAHANEIENEKLRNKVIEHAEQALMSKRLATIILDVPVVFDEEDLNYSGPNPEKINAIFDELEFRNLAKRVFTDLSLQSPPTMPAKAKATPSKSSVPDLFSDLSEEERFIDTSNQKLLANIHNTPHSYHLVTTDEEIEALVNEMNQQKAFCFDTETTGLDPISDELVGVSFSFKEHEGYYIPLPQDQPECERLLAKFASVFSRTDILKIGQNMKFDLNFLKKYHISVAPPLFDTMLAHYILHPETRHNLNLLSETLLGYQPVEIETLIGKKGKTQLNMRSVDLELIKEYATEDSDIALQLKNVLEPQLTEKQADKLFYTIEMPLVQVLSDMELAGVKIDQQALAEFSKQLHQEVAEIQKQVFELAGTTFNIASPKQLGEILFDKMQIVENARMTKTKQYQTGEEVLVKLRHKHPIIDMILDFRTLTKLKSTYVDALPLLINSHTKRIHTSFNQAVTATGRLSSTNPNLQNIPIRTERGKEIRKAFVAVDSDHKIVSADYSQIELRIIASLSGDTAMIDAFKHNIDIHTATAAKVFNVPLDEVTKEMRRNAKAVNFGIIYGISAFGLAEQTGASRKQASEWIEEYFNQYPGIKNYMDSQIEFAREHGYVETIFNRRRYLPDILSSNGIVRGFAERNAINAPIQGSAADIIKLAMINIHQALEKSQLQSKMTIQVHDELVFDVLNSELEQVVAMVKQEMMGAVSLAVPLEVEINWGNNWLEAH